MLAVCSSLSSSGVMRSIDAMVPEQDVSAASSSVNDALALIGQYGEMVQLHQGRHSTVWSAKDSSSATVVIKAYYKQKMKPRHARHVVRETRLLQVFRDNSCRGVVRLQEAWEDDRCVYLIFEPCMKGDLFQLMMKQHGTLQEGFVACHVIAPLLSTLSLLHALNIVHRDVKTENVFLASNGEVQLGDFGLVAHKLHDHLVDRVGTLDYMAPEVLSMPTSDEERDGGSRLGLRQPYDEKVDIWAVGVLVFELLVGRPPFEVEDPRETARLILAAQLPSFPSHLPQDCVDFITSALQVQPSDRPSASQLREHAWLQRHVRSARPNSPAQLATREVHDGVDVAALRQSIWEAWKTDELEQSINMMSLADLPENVDAFMAELASIPTVESACQQQQQQHQNQNQHQGLVPEHEHDHHQHHRDQHQHVAGKATQSRPRSRTPSGSGRQEQQAATLHSISCSPSQRHHSDSHAAVPAAGQLSAANHRTAGLSSEVKKYRSMSHSCYTVLGKALALSVGRVSPGPKATTVEESSRSFDAGQSAFAPTELIASGSSQSFTSSACGRGAGPDRDMLQVWQQSAAPPKSAGKARSRFAS